jgi:cyclin H
LVKIQKKMSIFHSSTQNTSWTFTPEKLVEIRAKAREDSITRLSLDLDYLTPSEHFIILQSYEVKMQSICAKLKITTTTTSTAVLYFKRFFLYFTLFEFDVNNVM